MTTATATVMTTVTSTTDPLVELKATIKGARHLASLIFPVEPVPASRPRVTRWGTYIAKPYKDWINAATASVESCGSVVNGSPADTLLVITTAICTRAKTSKLTLPRGDSDNYGKAALDLVTKLGGYWHDDKQVAPAICSKRFAAKGERARTEVHIYLLP